MPRLSSLLVLTLTLGLAACSSSEPISGPAPSSPDSEGTYAVVDGTQLAGRWDAVAALDDDRADSDLRSGQLERQLVFYPGRRVVLTGVDRTVSSARRSFEGRISGRSLTFDELDGAATVRMDGNRLVLTDPRGRRTVYVQR